ncbi:A-kinase anchor protein 200 [Battus philenor]|uniref:A-kinase anchor protein 200 n=1 Tax=Battus philenor TaxID=42288 RepID=UPI0035D0B988
MGAKQSKRSVDISGKEAESAGEVAAAGAGGEGRVEQLADADALKPQLNGDAHIHETSDKEKQLDTPEIEKDATTEKESKDGEEAKEKDAPVVTNGESEQKEENGEAVAASEDLKKPKKEKVKKKWSLRSISFSRKDKPKQEKKAKEDDAKTPNGDSEKLPEEVAETNPENTVNEVAEEAKSETETKDEKTPETPVTEPITNGSNTPESPKTDPSPIDESNPETPQDIRPEPNVALPEPEQLPVNGLSLEEPKVEVVEMAKSEESNIEKPTSDAPESVPVAEIPVIKEVCVEQISMIEPSPPPLPANPPPSSVVSFAATTMAPELTDASLATDITSSTAPISIATTTTEAIDEDRVQSNLNHAEKPITDVLSITKETLEDTTPEVDQNKEQVETENDLIITGNEINESKTDFISPEEIAPDTPVVLIVPDNVKIPDIVLNEAQDENSSSDELYRSKENHDDTYAAGDKEIIVNDKKDTIHSNKKVVTAEIDIATDFENLKNATKDGQELPAEEMKCNGTIEHDKSESVGILPNATEEDVVNKVASPDDSMPPSLSEAMESQAGEVSNDASESFPLPPSELCRYDEASPTNSPSPAISQDILPVTDKMADLIPEVPVVPELKTDMETSDVVVAN